MEIIRLPISYKVHLTMMMGLWVTITPSINFPCSRKEEPSGRAQYIILVPFRERLKIYNCLQFYVKMYKHIKRRASTRSLFRGSPVALNDKYAAVETLSRYTPRR